MQGETLTCRGDSEWLQAGAVHGQDKQHDGPLWMTRTHKILMARQGDAQCIQGSLGMCPICSNCLSWLPTAPLDTEVLALTARQSQPKLLTNDV